MTDLRKRDSLGHFIKEDAEKRFWRAVKKTATCWEWMGCRHYKGYGEFSLKKGNDVKAHRFSWELKFGKIPRGLILCHKCDNPPCVNPDHLFLGTDKENKDDSIQKCRHAIGERCGTSKLKEADVLEIRFLDYNGVSRRHIAICYGISGRNVTSICRRDSWKHLK